MGFDMEKFIVGITDDKKCALCNCVLDNPVRTPCDHLFCSGCILPWVVRHGKCPRGCRALTPCDLDNVLPLRKTILDMRVKCDFVDRGCEETFRLMDLMAHSQDCAFRPMGCGNQGCPATLNAGDRKHHEIEECPYRPVGICRKGCGQVLLFLNQETHDCVQTLKSHINHQEIKISSLNEDLRRLSSKFMKRERGLVGQVAGLHTEIQVQALRFDQKLKECKQHLDRLSEENTSQKCVEVEPELDKITIMLERDKTQSLGFNIMGGFTNENNNSKVTDGIIVSRVTEGRPADTKGLKLYDRIIKVNGQDLSNSSHEEAVDAFRAAQEPIVVEVLRRAANKPHKMKSRSPTLVSIGTQTEEDFYCYNRPPTPPPFFFPQNVHGLYQPSSRRPVAFSPSADMGLTDIEMSHNMEYDDPYFDDRNYEMEYEEIILTRTSSDEKLGLTLCYGSLEDEVTDIFISEVDPCSIAGNDGRIREGDQLLQINGVDVHSRDQAIKLFAEQQAEIALIVARPHLQCEDVYMENMVLDDLHMDLLEKHHHDNMQFMASMLARRHLDEEGGTTDTATTENSSNKQDKDSGVGRTDESMKNDESSEQDTYDVDSVTPPTKFHRDRRLDKDDHHHSNESFTSNDPEYANNEISADACDKFRQVLENRCGNSSSENSPRKQCMRKDSESSLERELSLLNQEMEEIQFECQEIVQAHFKEQNKLGKQDSQKSPRIVPRMGTRLDYMKQMHAMDLSEFWIRKGEMSNMRMGQQMTRPSTEKDRDMSTTSAYNTAESCRSTPLTLELNQASDEGDKGFKNSMLCLAVNVPSSSDTEKQTQTPTKPRDYSSDDSGHGLGTLPNPKLCVKDGKTPEKVSMGESLQDLYMQYADVMYTNRANLEHTIAVQQKLFQQQIKEHRGGQRSAPMTPSASKDGVAISGNDASKSPNTQSESGAMEWVVKRRPDGTRYITRRPVRNKLLKERGRKIHEERLGMTTDDDAMSEMKTGRYWSKEDRKKHIERARDYRRKKEMIQKERMETLKEAEEKKEVNIVELSHRKMMKHKNKKVLDNFVTVQEVLAHGSRVPEGKGCNPLLSVTTV